MTNSIIVCPGKDNTQLTVLVDCERFIHILWLLVYPLKYYATETDKYKLNVTSKC